VRLAYFDCFSGISGDMALGALIHAGADLDGITEALEAFPVDGFLIEREEVDDHGILASRIHIKTRPHPVVRTYAHVRRVIEASSLSAGARRLAGRIFHRLAEAMGRVHGKEPDLVTFNEMGEIEVMVEVLGVAVALDMLGVDRVFASPIPTGMGMMHGEHGLVPIPSAEVVELLQAVPTYTRGMPVELVTPVGAAIAAAVVEGFGDMPLMRAEQVGYGAGHPRIDFPNLLRVVIGEEEPAWRRAQAPPARRWSESPEEAAGADGSDGSSGATAGAGAVGGVRGVRDAAAAGGATARAGSAASDAADRDGPDDQRRPGDWLGPAGEVFVHVIVHDPGDPNERSAILESLAVAGAAEAWATPAIVRGGAASLAIIAVATLGVVDGVARIAAGLPGAGPVRISGEPHPSADPRGG
jgi:hypothetical protein